MNKTTEKPGSRIKLVIRIILLVGLLALILLGQVDPFGLKDATCPIPGHDHTLEYHTHENPQ